MVNQYVVIIDNRDGQKFQNLLYQNFSPYEKRLLKKYNSEAIWGFHDGIIKKKVWNNIKKNDIVFLTLPNENFKIYGIVSGTTIDSSFSNSPNCGTGVIAIAINPSCVLYIP